MKNMMLSIMAMIVSILSGDAQTYQVGDIYDVDGVKGIVVNVDVSGQHGLIMSLKGFKGKWGKVAGYNKFTKAYDELNGVNNCKKIKAFINSDDFDSAWEDFPLFDWTRSLGDGWYIPSNEELKLIARGIGGCDYPECNVDKVMEFNDRIKKAKGETIVHDELVGGLDAKSKITTAKDRFLPMFSSTERKGGYVYMLSFRATEEIVLSDDGKHRKVKQKGEFQLIPAVKNPYTSALFRNQFSRAVHKF